MNLNKITKENGWTLAFKGVFSPNNSERFYSVFAKGAICQEYKINVPVKCINPNLPFWLATPMNSVEGKFYWYDINSSYNKVMLCAIKHSEFTIPICDDLIFALSSVIDGKRHVVFPSYIRFSKREFYVAEIVIPLEFVSDTYMYQNLSNFGVRHKYQFDLSTKYNLPFIYQTKNENPTM